MRLCALLDQLKPLVAKSLEAPVSSVVMWLTIVHAGRSQMRQVRVRLERRIKVLLLE